MIFNRVHAYASGDTHQCKPIGDLLRRYARKAFVIVDPFARNCKIGTITNDIDPNTSAQYHMDARNFMEMLIKQGVKADLIILDPPYSPRQISDLYKSLDIPVSMQTTQNAPLYAKVKKLSNKLLRPGGHVVTLGWNSMGMGKSNLYQVIEILLVCHGGSQNDTICMVEKRVAQQLSLEPPNTACTRQVGTSRQNSSSTLEAFPVSAHDDGAAVELANNRAAQHSVNSDASRWAEHLKGNNND